MKRIILFSFLLLAVGFISFTYPNPKSTGAPASSTGAPGEVTCNTSGCHDDGVVNHGRGKLWLEIDELDYEINPGKVYNLTITISRSFTRRFGFELVALTEDGKQAGSFLLTDKSRTQLLTNDTELKDRMYLTYTYPGTQALETDLGQWTAQWQAPKKVEGKITFYLAGVAANDDGSDKGDEVYTYQKVLLPHATEHLQTFPNPFGTKFQVVLPTTAEETVVSILNQAGKLIYRKPPLIALGQALDLEISPMFPAGVYFLQVESSSYKSCQKLIKE